MKYHTYIGKSGSSGSHGILRSLLYIITYNEEMTDRIQNRSDYNAGDKLNHYFFQPVAKERLQSKEQIVKKVN
jgi:hypothetical protein